MNRPKVETVIVDLEGRDEEELITALPEAEDNYQDDADYELIPGNRPGHNSNSYVSGILKSVGLEPPDVKSDTRLQETSPKGGVRPPPSVK